MDVKIEARNVEMTPRWKADIEERMADLSARHDGLTHARVTLTKNSHHRQGEQVAEVALTVTTPPRQVMTARKEKSSFEEAIKAAFAAVDGEITKFREKRAAH
jgi:ribosomal subunit interface protein